MRTSTRISAAMARRYRDFGTTLQPRRIERQSLLAVAFHNLFMPRRLVLVALMLSLLLQASVLGQPFGGTGGKAQSSLHDLLHWARMAHHHHARQTLSDDEVQAFDAAFKDLDLPASAYAVLDDYSQDQSSDSTQHVLMDGCLVGPAMIPSWPGAMGARPAGGDAPHRVAERMVPAPFIEGPHRPPRHTA